MRKARIFATIMGVLAVGLFIHLYQPGRRAAASGPSPYLVQGSSPVGVVLLSESTGSIYACGATTSVTASSNPPFDSIAPIGQCAGIGGMPTASLTGNGFVSMSFNGTYNDGSIGVGLPYGVAFVGNLATGYVVQCTYQYVPTTSAGPIGAVFGSCIPVANPVR
jgi:hypothetical protein